MHGVVVSTQVERRAPDWFRRIADASQDVIYVYRLDPPGFIYVSPSAARIVGYAPEELYANGHLGRRIIHRDDRRQLWQHLFSSPAAPARIQVRACHRDGRIVWLEQQSNAIRNGDGRVVALHGIARDITDRKQAEEALRESESRYRHLFESHPQPMWVFDADTLRFLAVNEAAQQFYGYTRDEFLAMTALDLRPEEDHERFRRIIRDSSDLPQRSAGWRHRRKNGDLVEVFINANPITFGGHRARLVMALDMTAQRRGEEERQALERALLHAQKMESVGRLAGGVAHDFNNLLTVISGYAALLAEDVEADDTVRTRVDEILRAADRAKELTRKLLIFSRKHPYEPRIVALDEFVTQEALMLPRLIGEHITVHTALGAPEVCVRADPAQLTQILINLIVNARDAMPDGGRLALATTAERVDRSRAALPPDAEPGTYARLSVADTGSGMDAHVQAHLFEPFFTTKGMGYGTGLGLATAYGLVRQAGGFIEVDTAPQRGTTMSVFLPVSTDEPARDVQEPPSAVRGGHESILVVEDEPSVRELTSRILIRLGYQVVQASSPADAIGRVEAGVPFDLVVTDIVMPGMNGRQLVTELEQRVAGFAVLYVSGFAETGIAATTDVHADAAHFLAKPFNPLMLARKVRDLLDAQTSAR